VTSTDVAYRVLIVDDDAQMIADLREVLAEELTDLGDIHFEDEQDFAAAEKRLIDEDFDLVILDVRDAADGRPSAAAEARGHELYDAIAGAR
jgi:CheY-like chemotaxis protein